jgi:hypothetical protein
MMDKTLKKLWETKDNITKEHDYDMDMLVSYLKSKSTSRDNEVFQASQKNTTEQDAHTGPSPSRRVG